MITIKKNKITVEEYLKLRAQVNWKVLIKEQAEQALKNSLIVVGAYEQEELIGMGRIVGDKAVISYVQDLIVIPSHQKKGIGSTILNTLIDYVEEIQIPDTEMMLCLMCAKGRESFYEEHGFLSRPTKSLGPGMIQYLKK